MISYFQFCRTKSDLVGARPIIVSTIYMVAAG
jgi:hypothetical protein